MSKKKKKGSCAKSNKVNTTRSTTSETAESGSSKSSENSSNLKPPTSSESGVFTSVQTPRKSSSSKSSAEPAMSIITSVNESFSPVTNFKKQPTEPFVAETKLKNAAETKLKKVVTKSLKPATKSMKSANPGPKTSSVPKPATKVSPILKPATKSSLVSKSMASSSPKAGKKSKQNSKELSPVKKSAPKVSPVPKSDLKVSPTPKPDTKSLSVPKPGVKTKPQLSTPKIKPRTVLPSKPRKRKSKKVIQNPPSHNLLKCFGYSLDKPFSTKNKHVKVEINKIDVEDKEKTNDKDDETKSGDNSFILHVRPDLETTKIDSEVIDDEFIESGTSDEEEITTKNDDRNKANINVGNIASFYSKSVEETNSHLIPSVEEPTIAPAVEDPKSILTPSLTEETPSVEESTTEGKNNVDSDDEISIIKVVPGKNPTTENPSVKVEIKEEIEYSSNVEKTDTIKTEDESKLQLQEFLRSSQSHKINRIDNKLNLLLNHFNGQNNLSSLSKLIDSTSPSTTIMPETITLDDDLDDKILASPNIFSFSSKFSSSLPAHIVIEIFCI